MRLDLTLQTYWNVHDEKCDHIFKDILKREIGEVDTGIMTLHK